MSFHNAASRLQNGFHSCKYERLGFQCFYRLLKSPMKIHGSTNVKMQLVCVTEKVISGFDTDGSRCATAQFLAASVFQGITTR